MHLCPAFILADTEGLFSGNCAERHGDNAVGTGALITYLKLVTGGVKQHLCLANQAATESVTLCGCVVTRLQSWKQINSLEGDECPNCAALAFGGARKTEVRSSGD